MSGDPRGRTVSTRRGVVRDVQKVRSAKANAHRAPRSGAMPEASSGVDAFAGHSACIRR